MSRIIITVCTAVTLCLLFVTGCSKKSQPPAPAQEKTKTAAEYKAQADKEIKQENANQELDKLQKSIDDDAAQEQK
jgi:outer membrane lipoprotein-sorting protein